MKNPTSKLQYLFLYLSLFFTIFLPSKVMAGTDYFAGISQKILDDFTTSFTSIIILTLLAAAIMAIFSRWGAILVIIGGVFVAGILVYNNTDIANWIAQSPSP